MSGATSSLISAVCVVQPNAQLSRQRRRRLNELLWASS